MFKSIKKRVNKVSTNIANSSRHGRPGSAATSHHGHTTPKAKSKHPKSTPSTTKSKRSTKRRGTASRIDEQIEEKAWCQPVPHLERFDACIEASDALATAAGHSVGPCSRRDEATGLLDCSVLVSPNGELLLVPQGQHETLYKKKEAMDDVGNLTHSNHTTNNSSSPHDDGPDTTDNPLDESESLDREASSSSDLMTELMQSSAEDYESAVFLGNDLHPSGDAALNHFSGRGWSIGATSVALEQTEQSLQDMRHFCEQLILTKKQAAAQTSTACDALRMAHPAVRSSHNKKKRSSSYSADEWLMIDPKATDFEMTPHRVGPLLATDSTLHAALTALEHYHADMAESDANRWRQASLQKNALLPALQQATKELTERAGHRQLALEEMSRRVRFMEDRLKELKDTATRQWEAVYHAEDQVTQRVQEMLHERSREREKRRLEEMREIGAQQSVDSADGGATSEEIWDLVHAAAESMEDGSFEPLPDVPGMTLNTSRDQSLHEDINTLTDTAPETDLTDKGSSHNVEKLAPASREHMEQELGLPQLRAQAMAADDAIEDAANSLLNILSNLDTTRRSARIAAETCLVSASNAQAACIRSLIQLERASLEERLCNLQELERIAKEIDVRADLDAYITTDKKERGGSSHLGDDDDGGVASALAVLSSHVEGTVPHSSASSTTAEDVEETDEVDDDKTTPEMLEEAIEEIFEDNRLLQSDASQSEETTKARSEFENSVDFLCKIAADSSPSARAKRSSICYALNSKRGSNAELKSSIQFDGLCRLFSAILTGCNSKDGGISNAKMCMMLAQTFYVADSDEADDAGNAVGSPSPVRQARSKRVYIKGRLSDHPIWSKDEFWDQALYQCVSESLTHSGVMQNFERYTRKTTGRKSEFTQTRKTKWHDLTNTERIEASSQVHAVVFAQLGALAHSMIEFNCGLERSCAFVRRMAVRNQLPSSQRTMLLQHLMDRDDVDRRESSTSSPPSMSRKSSSSSSE